MGVAMETRLILTTLGIFLLGCSETQYVSYDDGRPTDQIMVRAVEFEVFPTLYEAPPNCVIVLKPLVEPGLQQFSLPVERAFSRYLSEKVSRVVDGAKRDTIARQMALDLSQKSDLGHLADEPNCGAVLISRIVGPGDTFLLLWSRVQIGIEGQLIRISDGATLWRARHVTGRSDGGLSISPIGIAVDAISSASLVNDKDVTASVADDGVRRLMGTRPNPF